MKIKKKDLRRGLAQLPINYPDPDVAPDALPGGVLDMDAELVQVELICKRLGHNEVVVRDAALADVPRYLEKLTKTLADMETEYAEEIESIRAYFAAHPKAHNPYRYDNIPLALSEFRQRAHEEDQKMRRRQALRELKQQREQQRRAKANYGRYGADATEVEGSGDEEAQGEEGRQAPSQGNAASANAHKTKYSEWMQTWCDAELIFLKLARGLHFCLWHSDKPLVQLECAQRIADLIRCPATIRSQILFYGSLFRVVAREWPTIDRYRMDKYLALVRRMLHAWVLLVKDVAAAAPTITSAGGGVDVAASAVTEAATPRNGHGTAAAAAATGAGRKRGATKTASKRDRESDATAEEEGGEESGGDASQLSAANSAKGVPELYIKQYHTGQPLLCNVLREIFYILQVQIIPSTTSVGLTMHLCDVAFDELTKAFLPVPLFITLSAGIPLYAMSQGNFVEKRVLDSFFPPLAGGVFTQRRAAQILEKLKKDQKKRRTGKSGAAAAVFSPEELEREAERLGAMDNDGVLGEVAHCCQLFSVSRGTARAVRVMFSEAELVLQQARSPESYQSLTRTAQRRRIEREIEEVNETRTRVREERNRKREEKKLAQQSVIREKVKARKAALLTTAGTDKKAKKAAKTDQAPRKDGDAADEVAVDEKTLKKAILAEEKQRKAKPTPRDTKRKKNYRLTKKDLYDSGDDEDEQ